ncbi:hypothetical protein [uncultured Ruegeria sp.]|uniref:hypothetical protein n=1 Tax=uncultured Ruegeria sp. TaxID=259304 RepID=UPI002610B5CE|nr:hypothetical protein [uncultured Ruegeria sp.]
MANGHGGARSGAGRKSGAVSQAKKAISEDAKKYGADALSALSEIMRDVEQPASARVSAAVALLDRGHGKPSQTVLGSGDEGEHIIKAYGWLSPQE